MIAFRKKLFLLIAVAICSITMIGCKGVPIKQVEAPLAPVISNIAKYEAPDRSNAPEPVKVEGAIG